MTQDTPRQLARDKSALEAARAEAGMTQEKLMQDLSLAEEVGKIKMAKSLSAMLDLGVVRWFADMKESKAYKGQMFPALDGGTFTPTTFDELCTGLGFSKQLIYEQLQNFTVFGEESLKLIRDMGIKRRDVRKLRAALEGGDLKSDDLMASLQDAPGEEVQATIDVLCTRIDKLKKQVVEQKKTLEVKDKLASESATEQRELREKLIKATSIAPDEQEERLRLKLARTRTSVDDFCGRAEAAIATLVGYAAAVMADEELPQEGKEYCADRVALLCRAIANGVLNSGLDIDFAQYLGVDPEWMHDDTPAGEEA